jgi:uroporphyrinogen-III decarboxylase
MASSGAQSIAIDECMALDYVGEVAQEYSVGFIGNLHVTAGLFEQSEDIVADAQRCLHEGRRSPGYVFGLGGPITQHINMKRFEEAIAAFHKYKHRTTQ